MGSNDLTTLAKRLRPLLLGVAQGAITQALTAGEGPGIDIVGGSTIGLGLDSILLAHADGTPASEYAVTGAGFEAALAAAVEGDIVVLPPCSISPAGSDVYTAGAEISTGAITVTSQTGAEITGLTIGEWYAVEATGGPWTNGIGSSIYSYSLSNDNGASWNDPAVDPANSALPTWAAHRENVDANHVRVYFQATTTAIKIRVGDSPGFFGDNGGNLGYSLKAATLTTPTAIPSGVEVVGLGRNSVIDGDVVCNGKLTNLTVTGAITGASEYLIYSTGGLLMTNKPISMGAQKITDLADPTADQDAATKAYVDANGALDDLTDVVITTPSNGQVLKYNDGSWVNGTDSTGSGGAQTSYDPDAAPASPSSYDDEFGDGTLAAKWTASASYDASFSLKQTATTPHASESLYTGLLTMQGSIDFSQSFTPTFGNAFTVVAKIHPPAQSGSGQFIDVHAHLAIVGNSDSTYEYEARVGWYNNNWGVRVIYSNNSGSSEATNQLNGAAVIHGPAYLMITKTTGTSFSVFFSHNGISWRSVDLNRNLSAWSSLTKIKIGSTQSGSNIAPICAFDWVRYWASEAKYDIGANP